MCTYGDRRALNKQIVPLVLVFRPDGAVLQLGVDLVAMRIWSISIQCLMASAACCSHYLPNTVSQANHFFLSYLYYGLSRDSFSFLIPT
jgi:hypothetical protein